MVPTTFPEIGQLQEESVPLFTGNILLKSVKEGDVWTFAGIASDEEADVDGDAILKKHLDLSYAKTRGYVNWDHSREPRDQIGFLTNTNLIVGDMLKSLEQKFETQLSSTASVYVEGEFYKHMPRAVEVRDMLKSASPGRGPGLSLDGSIARDKSSGGIIKAFVRGVAFSPVPAQTRTLCALKKSLRDYSASLEEPNGLPATADNLLKSAEKQVVQGMSFDEAIVWVLKAKPHWTYDLAKKVVEYTIKRRS